MESPELLEPVLWGQWWSHFKVFALEYFHFNATYSNTSTKLHLYSQTMLQIIILPIIIL